MPGDTPPPVAISSWDELYSDPSVAAWAETQLSISDQAGWDTLRTDSFGVVTPAAFATTIGLSGSVETIVPGDGNGNITEAEMCIMVMRASRPD